MLMEARLLDERREGKAEGIAEGEANANIATAKRLLRVIMSIPLKNVVWKIGSWSFRMKQPP